MNGFRRVFRQTALTVAVAVAWLACAGAHPLSDYAAIDSVAYRIDYQGWITVNASVNGDGPNDFIVDSGATITSVFANLAERQDFQPAGRGPIRILGLASAQALPAYRLGEIKVGGLALENHVGVILPDWAPPNTPPQGVIGLDLLAGYTVMVDATEGRIKFYPAGVKPKKRRTGWSRTALKPLEVRGQETPLYQITVSVRSVNIPCIIDLGASGTIFNKAALRAMSRRGFIDRYGTRGATTTSRLTDIFDTSSKAVAIKIARLRIGRRSWRDGIFVVYDAEIFRELHAEGKPFCLAGMDLFTDRSIIFDFDDERFYIGPTEG